MIVPEDFDFDEGIIQATKRAKEMIQNGLFSRFGLSEESRIEKAMVGCLGELAFEHLLQSRGINYETDREFFRDRVTDDFDFLVNGNKLDVKIARKSTRSIPKDAWSYGYPVEQRPELKDYIVIGWADFILKEVGFYGWTTGDTVRQLPVLTTNSFKGYKYLTPNHEFQWGMLEKNFDVLLDKLSATL